MTEPKPDYIARMEAEQAKRAERQETLDELREEIDRMHRKALEESPYSNFVSRVPIGLLANLSPQERAELDAHERAAFDKHQPLAQAKEQQRAACIAAGGTAEAFEAEWKTYGRDMHAAQVAGELLERAKQDNVF